jgi:hypothetical protein
MSQPTLLSETRELVQLVAQSKALFLDCRRLVAQSRTLIGASRRHLNPFLEISGASHDGVREIVREGLENGELFPVDGNGFGARGRRQLCIVCDVPVLPAEMGITIAEPRPAHAHASCYAIWLEESSAWRESHKKLVRSRKG